VGVLAADYRYKSVLELEGQLEGFQHVNLDSEGLSEYRAQLLALGIRDLGASGSASSLSSASSASASGVAAAASAVFDMIDKDRSGSITLDEAESIVLRLNSQLKRAYGEKEVRAFFAAVSVDGVNVSRGQFLEAFIRLAA
jgi:hypothetical protein